MKKIALSLFVLAAISTSAQKINSKLNFQKGQKIEVMTNMNASTEMMMGESSSSSVSTEVYEVKDVAAENTTLERSMKKLKMNLSIMGQEKSIDSDNPDDLKGMLGEPIKELVNTKNEFTVDAKGKIIVVKGEDKKKKADNGMMGMFMQQMNMGNAAPATGSPSVFKVLPDYEVGKGDSWVDTAAAAGNVMITSYTVKDITDSEILLDFTGDGKLDTKQDMMGMSIEAKGTIKSNGSVVIDKATGLMKQKTVTTITDSNANFNGQELNTKNKTTAVITVKSI